MGVMSEIQHWKQVDFNSHVLDIRDKKHWWTKIDVDWYSWDSHLALIDTHPDEVCDWNRDKQRLACNNFHNRPSAPQFAKDIWNDMNNYFVPPAPKKAKYEKGHPHITNIAFTGFGRNSDSYPRHKDNMDVFLIQVLGDIPIRIGYGEEESNDDELTVMKPGDAVWIPRGTYHQLYPQSSRCTFSFGFESDDDCDPAFFI